MEQELRIKIKVDKQTGELSTVGAEFDKLSNSAGKAATNTKQLESSTHSLSGAFGKLRGMVSAYIGLQSVKEYVRTTDSMKLLESRVALVASATDDYLSIQKELLKTANDNRTSLESIGQLYVKLKDPISKLGGSTQTALEITDAFSKTLLLSGANTQEAASATLQFAQAMASGVLRGDEFRSIAEASPKVLKVLSNELGVSAGQLRKMAEDGQLTAGVVGGALLSSFTGLESEVKSIKPTVSGAFEIFNNELSIALEKMDKAVGVNQLFIDSISGLTDGVKALPSIFSSYDKTIDNFTTKHAYAYAVLKKLDDFMGHMGDKVSDTTREIGKGTSTLIDSSSRGFVGWLDNMGKTLEYYGLLSAKIDEINAKPSIVPSRPFDTNTVKQSILDMTAFQREEMRQRSIDTLKYNSGLEVARQKAEEEAKKARDKAIKEAEKDYKKTIEETQKFNDEQFALTAQNSTKSIRQLDSEIDYKEIESNAKTALSDMENSYLAYYEAIGDESSAFYLKEEIAMNKLKEIGVLSHSQMLDMRAKNEEKFLNEQFKKNNEWLYDFFENVNKALDEQLLDGMRGKFTSFGAWMKSLFGSIGDSMLAGLSRSLAGGITNTVQSGFVNMFKTYGGLSASSSLVGETLSADDLSKIMSGGGVSVDGGVITTAGGTKIDQATGQVKSQGNDILSLVSTASSLKTAYGMITTGISGSIITGFQSASGLLANMGFGSAASGMMSFGAGVANPFAYAGMAGLPTSMTVGSALSGASLGGIGGYLVGSLGDKIFGADTYAGTTGAIGGALGGLGASLGLWGGPIGIIAGSLLGSVLGGLFGKTKVTGQGIDIFGNATADYADGRYYTSYKKKSWFSSKSWENYTGFNAQELEAIKQTIGAYDYLLAQLGEYNDLVVAGGRFSNLQSFLDTNVVKAFLGSINPQNLGTIYQSWVDYASEIDKTITEAISTAVGGYTTYKRGYTEWFLGSGTVEQLEFTANYLQKDFEALSTSLGAGSVTVDNFLSMYDAAIKENFTQDTIEAWASLGDALMKSTDAAKEYQDALDKLSGSTMYSLPADMLLQNLSSPLNQVDMKELVSAQSSGNKNLTKMVSYLYEIVKSQQELLKVTKYGTNQGIPA